MVLDTPDAADPGAERRHLFCDRPPSRYDTVVAIVEHLAVLGKEMRFGPIPLDEAPDFDILPPRTVGPQQLPNGRWVPGGGTDAATSGTLHLPCGTRCGTRLL